LSSAILYLAIVAIWAVVLVPRWLRPRAAQPEPAEQPPQTLEPAQPQAAEPAQPPAPEPVMEREPASPAPGDGPEPVEDADEPVPDERRADMLRARRRMLIALVVLAAGAAGLAVTRIAAYWVIVPPAVLLGGFLVLLREAAHIDAERARRATRSRYDEVPPVAGQEPESFREGTDARPEQVPATASAPDAIESQPDAEVIDISARLSDQVYDQYSDAAERAVGD